MPYLHLKVIVIVFQAGRIYHAEAIAEILNQEQA